MTNLNNSNQESDGKFKIEFRQNIQIFEESFENSLSGLCYQVFEAVKTFGDPVAVTFPNGQQYAWGEYGSWLAHQFAAEGRITEQQFVTYLTEHNQRPLTLAQQNVRNLESLIKASLAEVKQCEQRTQEAIAVYHRTFENYMLAKKALTEIENTQSHEQQKFEQSCNS